MVKNDFIAESLCISYSPVATGHIEKTTTIAVSVLTDGCCPWCLHSSPEINAYRKVVTHGNHKLCEGGHPLEVCAVFPW